MDAANTAFWGSLLVAIAALLVALVALPENTPLRRAVVVASLVLVVAAVGIGIAGNTGLFDGSANGGASADEPADPAGAEAAPGPDQVDAGAVPLARIDLSTDGDPRSTLYFGRLDAVLDELSGRVRFDVAPSAAPDLCVLTVVFTGVPVDTGEVYAVGFEDAGWTAAENAPDRVVEDPDAALHQQLIVPPASVRAGDGWRARAELWSGGAVQAVSRSYDISATRVAGEEQTWSVAGHEVSCGAT
jgi:hypothetical protein